MPEPANSRLANWAIRLLEWLSVERDRDIVVGDFAEAYSYIASEEGRNRAYFWYMSQLIRSLPAFLYNRFALGSHMLGVYGTSAIRNLKKRAFFSTLNIAGLAIGMATCLMIFHYVVSESSYDTFHENHNDLYRVVVDGVVQGGGETRSGKTWRALGPLMEAQLPDVSKMVRVHSNDTAIITYRPDNGNPNIYKQADGLFVDPTFFEVFGFRMLRGNAQLALSMPDQILLSKSMARKYFGEENPIGKTLELEGWTKGNFTVAGIFEDPPLRSHFTFNYLLPIENVLALEQYSAKTGWTWQNFTTYVQLLPGTNHETLSPFLTETLLRNKPDTFEQSPSLNASLQPITDIHLLPSGRPGAQHKRIYFFGFVGIFVLLIAWINFINLSTSRALERAQEVGVRKAIGASRGNLVTQFVVEALMTNGIAFVLAVGLLITSLPYLKALLDIPISGEVLLDLNLWLGLIGLFIIGVLLSCLYPAVILSSYRPAVILKSQTRSTSPHGGLRRILVVLQFSASTVLLIGTVAVFSQLEFMRSSELGLNLNQILIVDEPSRTDRLGTSQNFKEEVYKIPGVQSVSSGAVPGSGFFMDMPARKQQDHVADTRPFQAVFVDELFLETFDLDLVTGRNFSGLKSDALGTVLNEAGVQAFGFSSNQEAIGQRIVFNNEGTNYVTVIGVVKDFNWMSVKEEVGAIGFLTNRSEGPFSIKINSSNAGKTQASIKNAYETLYPNSPYDSYFADEYFNRQYLDEQNAGFLFGIFALLALLVACLGLIGLASYMVSQRTKEIGVRKILGASTSSVTTMFIIGFTKLLAIALAIAIPIAYLGLTFWLDSYARRIDLTVSLFLYPGISVLLIALLSVSYHSFRAARYKPVTALKYR